MLETPHRIEHFPTPRPATVEVGWFDRESFAVQLWFNGVALKDDSTWCELAAAIDAAERVVERYRLVPAADGSGLQVTVMAYRADTPMQRDTYGWSPAVPPGSGLRPVPRAARLAWVSALGLQLGEPQPQRWRFTHRFLATGPLPSGADLGALFRCVIDEPAPEALFGGLVHGGLAPEALSWRIVKPDPQIVDTYLLEVTGELAVWRLALPWGQADAPQLDVTCYPETDDLVWAHRSSFAREASTIWAAPPTAAPTIG